MSGDGQKSADVIDLAERRRRARTETESLAIDPNSMRIRFDRLGGFEIVVTRTGSCAGRELAWGVDPEKAEAIAGRVRSARNAAITAAFYAKHPEQMRETAPTRCWFLCGLRRDGGHGGRGACRRRRGHRGDHRNGNSSWSMPCPCPGSMTTIYAPDGSKRVGLAVCPWCQLRRDEQGRPVPTEVKPEEAR